MTATTVTLQARRGFSLVASAASALSVVALLVLLALTVLGHRVLVVRSDSMAPALRAGDLIVIEMQRPATVEPGEIVTFRDHSRGNVLVTHRVIESVRTDGQMHFKTRGDANSGIEQWSISTGGRLGQLRARIPGVGRVIVDAGASPWTRTGALGMAALLVGFVALRRIWAT